MIIIFCGKNYSYKDFINILIDSKANKISLTKLDYNFSGLTKSIYRPYALPVFTRFYPI